ncbi:hypothetical protein NFI96_000151, partial [Prochilodus magdalenae]
MVTLMMSHGKSSTFKGAHHPSRWAVCGLIAAPLSGQAVLGHCETAGCSDVVGGVSTQPCFRDSSTVLQLHCSGAPQHAAQLSGVMDYTGTYGYAAPHYPSPAAPPGLEYLTQLDQILVHQKVELLEAIIGFETNNQYDIKNSLGQKIYSAKEQNDCCTRNFCGPLRSFELKITDHNEQEVIHLIKPFRCTSCCCPCYLQE